MRILLLSFLFMVAGRADVQAQGVCANLVRPKMEGLTQSLWLHRIQQPSVRYILEETTEGRAILKALGFVTDERLSKTLAEKSPGFQNQFVNRLDILQESAKRYRRLATANRTLEDVGPGELTGLEKSLLSILSERYLTLRDTENLVFANPSEGIDPANLESEEVKETRGLKKRAEELLEWMKQCARNQPKQSRAKNLALLKATSLATSLSLTTFGSVSHSGVHDIKWGQLSTDLLINGLATLFGFHYISKDWPVTVRYVSILRYNWTVRNAADAVIYYFRPRVLADKYEKANPPEIDDALWRYTFNAGYAVLSTIPNLLVFDLLKGLACVTSDSSMIVKAAIPALNLGNSMLHSYIYFNTRPLVMTAINPPIDEKTK